MSDSAFLQGIHHAYAQTDGSYKWPNSREGDLLREAKREIDALIRLLAESQAREPVAWRKRFNGKWEIVNAHVFLDEDAIAMGWQPLYTMPSDSTALDAAIAKAKREENEACEGICNRFAGREMHPAECAAAIRMRRMADELKGGEQ